MPKPIIVDCTGERLTAEERALYRDLNPYGFILFGRHTSTPEQVRALVADLWEAVQRPASVFIDQEGGRVARLGAPHWRRPPAAWCFAELAARDPEAAVRAVWLNSRLIAADLTALGITVDCLPVLDLRLPGAHDIIGNRAYGATPEAVVTLARAAAEGLMAGGVLPVAKHIPGHGRAESDSHHELPVVTASLDELRRTDFRPFAELNRLPIAMTAHITYTAIDPDRPATLSPRVINDIIRGEIGFRGVLVSDDLTMKALKGALPDLALETMAAGCDLALLCNASFEDRRAVLETVDDISALSLKAINRYMVPRPAARCAVAELTAELDDLMADVPGYEVA
ncbi:beta-N-acetylhexosaminidase [Govanella unica]|uniref:beta-N-acetylhexosaminidase n=1 Tax=Govanella unica TaxID=2975056 RepID=A0A9X3TX03_9PROT|nr:beta-N-acetylhexosaminidase [Govania unica]MDA5193316.1 beta-N-acetylhexosaminidase [Govania unica]